MHQTVSVCGKGFISKINIYQNRSSGGCRLSNTSEKNKIHVSSKNPSLSNPMFCVLNPYVVCSQNELFLNPPIVRTGTSIVACYKFFFHILQLPKRLKDLILEQYFISLFHQQGIFPFGNH